MSADAAQQLLQNRIVLSALAACGTVWIVAAVRWCLGLPVIPYWTRRPVSWRGIDVLLMLMAYTFLPSLFCEASRLASEPSAVTKSKETQKASLDKRHAVQQGLSEKGYTVWQRVVLALLAIAIAPLTEELVFRLLLQGWLESVERRLRRQLRWLRRIVLD